jgi:hypothetical protein
MTDERGTTPHTTTDYRFAPIPEELLYDTEVSDLAVRVYGVLIRFGMTPGSCYPSQATIAARVGKATLTMPRPLRELEDRGWIVRVARYNEAGGRTSDGYHVRTSTAHLSAPPAHDSGVPPRADAGSPRAETAEEREPEEREPSNENTLALPGVAVPAAPAPSGGAFLEFWQACPRRTAKGSAAKAWAKATTRAHPADIIAGMVRFAEETAGTEPRFLPHPSTWLNADRWLDEPGANRRATASSNARPIDTDRGGPSGDVTDQWK